MENIPKIINSGYCSVVGLMLLFLFAFPCLPNFLQRTYTVSVIKYFSTKITFQFLCCSVIFVVVGLFLRNCPPTMVDMGKEELCVFLSEFFKQFCLLRQVYPASSLLFPFVLSTTRQAAALQCNLLNP